MLLGGKIWPVWHGFLHDSIRTWYPQHEKIKDNLACLMGGGWPEEWPGVWRIGSGAIASTNSPMEFEAFQSPLHCCHWHRESYVSLGVGGRDYGS